jgi:dTDP-4-amino-4,6-dideoxygalactose transaminase
MCALLLNIKQGDEIILPSYAYVSSANAFALKGGKPVFIDIDPDTCNIDPNKIEQSITKKTKAIVVIHYAGISCDMESIAKIAKKNKLILIEDAAHAILSSYKNRPLGSIGDLATLSFHETKNIHCGEGGALLINNPRFLKRAKVIRDKGTNRELFNKNIVKKYTWVDLGSSYGLSEINAAFLYAQLLKSNQITKKRKLLFDTYHNLLVKLEDQGFIKRPKIKKDSIYNGHIYYISILKNKRKKIINYLKKNNIISLFHYIPLHSSPFGKKISSKKFKMRNTKFISNNLLRLPIYYDLKISDVKNICKCINSFYKLN